MARRQQKESGLEALLNAPWWVSGVLAAGCYIVFNWIIPASLKGAMVPMGKALAPFGTIAAVAFGFLAIILYLRQRSPLPPDLSSSASGRQHPSYAPAPTYGNTGATERIEPALQAASPPKSTAWSLKLLRDLEWKRFEDLTAAFFREKSYRAETQQSGADGGIDVKLYGKESDHPIAVVQCKAWNTRQVGIKPVRELLGVITHEQVLAGIFMTTGEYTQEAIAFAKDNPITLLTGELFLAEILELPVESQQHLLAVATRGDYMTPTCPSCGIKLIHRTSQNGDFWGCKNYPRCKVKIFSKSEQ